MLVKDMDISYLLTYMEKIEEEKLEIILGSPRVLRLKVADSPTKELVAMASIKVAKVR